MVSRDDLQRLSLDDDAPQGASELKAMLERAVLEEREACASYCGMLAEMMEQGCGEGEPGGRLRQAERTIREGMHYQFAKRSNAALSSGPRKD